MSETNQNILVRNMPEGTLGQLKNMADENFRSLEGEARYALKSYAERNVNQIAYNHSKTEVSGFLMANQNKQEIQTLRHSEQCLNAVVYSISRKLAGGSESVSFDLLNDRKRDLAEVELKLISLGETPIAKS